MFDALSQDLKYGARSMRKHPVFTIVAILSLALGIGGNTAMFSLVNTLLLKKLPVRDPDALYQLMVTHRSATHNAFSYPDFQKLRDGFQILRWSDCMVVAEFRGPCKRSSDAGSWSGGHRELL